MNNWEWLKSLSIEEFADWMADMLFYARGENLDDEREFDKVYFYVTMYLQEKREEKRKK